MAIEITHVRFGSTRKTEDEIVRYKWIGTGKVGDTDKASLVKWVDDNGKAYVGKGAARVPVGVVRPDYGQPYLRTYADGKWTNNLLSLPTF
ncbi:DUF3892 domain-containing protein [Demequina gelatinilytica]|uniref:DUF3892 domain-containing protein n=1 Tax=Demequina gelatinilytica TaxID=1638980 RepID=UPI0007826D45|nr:DUF3892 domain-containing protein [Demequina gelatinilytica]